MSGYKLITSPGYSYKMCIPEVPIVSEKSIFVVLLYCKISQMAFRLWESLLTTIIHLSLSLFVSHSHTHTPTHTHTHPLQVHRVEDQVRRLGPEISNKVWLCERERERGVSIGSMCICIQCDCMYVSTYCTMCVLYYTVCNTERGVQQTSCGAEIQVK